MSCILHAEVAWRRRDRHKRKGDLYSGNAPAAWWFKFQMVRFNSKNIDSAPVTELQTTAVYLGNWRARMLVSDDSV